MEPEYEIGSDIAIINETEFSDGVVLGAIREQLPELAQTINNSVNSWRRSARSRNSTPFNQDQYSIPRSIFDQFRVAADAAKYDDTVSNAVEITEQLAFKRVAVECGDDDVNNIINQVIDDLNLSQRMREIWRELFIVSQCYVAVQWGRKDYKVKAMSDSGRQKKKVFKNLLVPTAISTLDPLKVIPVGNFLFGNERLVYLADDDEEALDITKSLAGSNSSDMIVKSLFDGPYTPSAVELSEIGDLIGGSMGTIGLANRLFYLNKDNVWRITASRSSYQRFADVRMTSIFELLDLKHNLRESDRSDILGNLNCIVLVTKGDSQLPATTSELEGVSTQMRQSSRNSLMISDHRIDIKIITKKTDWTLRPERHNALDSRITSRLFQILSTGNYCVTPDTEILTRTGWKTYDQLIEGEDVYSLNTETNLGEWSSVQAINIFHHEGEMLSLESRGHSSMSTPNHRWWIERKHGQAKIPSMEWVTSDEMKIFDRIPVSAECAGFPIESPYSDELVELAAWYWTEGHRQVGAPNRITISQSKLVNPIKCARIEKCLEKVFGPEGKVADGGVWYYSGEEYHVSASVTEPLLSLFEYEHVPLSERVTVPKRPKLDFIYNLTKEQMELFVEVCLLGDGHIENNGRRRWHQKDFKSIEIFEICLSMLGIANRSRLDKSREAAGVWSVELLSRDFTSPLATAHSAMARDPENPSATAEWVPYSGIVWCPTTTTGTWFARRNGISYFTGNSSGSALDDSTKLFKVIAASMEARRDNIRDSLADNLINKIWDRNSQLKGEPEIMFQPRRIALDFDPNFTQIVQELFATGNLSRETMLSELDISQEQEAFRVQKEEELYGDIFTPKLLPGQGLTPKQEGRMGGGNSNGGGMNPDSFIPNPDNPTADKPGPNPDNPQKP